MEGGFVKEDQTILAKLSQASYKPSQEKIGNWTLVHKSPNVSLFVNEEGIPIISVRGTKPTDAGDLYADSMIPLNKLGSTDRYKADYKTIKSLSAGKPFFAVGHSLGGAIIDELIQDGLVSEAVTFNPAIQPKHVNAGVPNMRIYMKGDPLYTLFGQWDKNSIVVSKKTVAEGIRDALLNLTNIGSVVAAVLSHKLTSFTGEGSKMEKQIHHKKFAEKLLEQLRIKRAEAFAQGNQERYAQLNDFIQNDAKPNIENQSKVLKEYLYQHDVKLHGKGKSTDKVKALEDEFGNRVVRDVLKALIDDALRTIKNLTNIIRADRATQLLIIGAIIGSYFTPASVLAGIPTTAVGLGIISTVTDDIVNRRYNKEWVIEDLKRALTHLATLTPERQREWLRIQTNNANSRYKSWTSLTQHPHSTMRDLYANMPQEIPEPYRTNVVTLEAIPVGTKMVRYHALDQVAGSSNASPMTLVDNGAIGHIPQSDYSRMKGQRDSSGRIVGEQISTYVGKGVQTHKQKVQKKLKLKPNGYSIEELAVVSNVPIETLQEVYNRGIGAYETNPTSVRMKGSYKKGVKAPMSQKLSKEQWAMARVYSFLDGNKKHDNDLRGGMMPNGPRPPRPPIQAQIPIGANGLPLVMPVLLPNGQAGLAPIPPHLLAPRPIARPVFRPSNPSTKEGGRKKK